MRWCSCSQKLATEPEWMWRPRQIIGLGVAVGFTTARAFLFIIRTGLGDRFRNGLNVTLIFMPTEYRVPNTLYITSFGID